MPSPIDALNALEGLAPTNHRPVGLPPTGRAVRSRRGQRKKTAGEGKEDRNLTGWRDHSGGRSLSLALYILSHISRFKFQIKSQFSDYLYISVCVSH